MKKIHVEKIDSFTGHKDCVYALALSPSPNHFISSSGDGQIVQWNIEKTDWGKRIAFLNSSVYSLFFDAQKNTLWIGLNYEGIHVIDVQNNDTLASIKLTSAAIFDIKIYDDKAFVASGDGIISVIDIASYSFIKHIKASDKSVRVLEVNPYTNELIAGYSDDFIRVFDVKTYSMKFVLEGHTNSVFALALNKNSTFLVSGGRDASLKIWEVGDEYALYKSINAHLFAINAIDFQPEGNFFATCSMDKSIKIWDAETFQLIKVIDKGRHAGHGTSINSLKWLNDSVLLACSDDKTISAWKLIVDTKNTIL